MAPLVREDEKEGGKRVLHTRVWEEVGAKLERIRPGILASV